MKDSLILRRRRSRAQSRSDLSCWRQFGAQVLVVVLPDPGTVVEHLFDDGHEVRQGAHDAERPVRDHSTGHESRLLRTFGDRFGDELYGKEELVAEMGAAFLCTIAGIANEHTDRNTTAYIQNWISRLEADNRLVIHAAANAQRAADCILGTTFEDSPETTEDAEKPLAAALQDGTPTVGAIGA